MGKFNFVEKAILEGAAERKKTASKRVGKDCLIANVIPQDFKVLGRGGKDKGEGQEEQDEIFIDLRSDSVVETDLRSDSVVETDLRSASIIEEHVVVETRKNPHRAAKKATFMPPRRTDVGKR